MIRVGIIGAGAMAEYQVKKFGAIPGCNVIGYINNTANIPKNIDALSCAVADIEHYRICEWALNRGIPIFCEKPLARNV